MRRSMPWHVSICLLLAAPPAALAQARGPKTYEDPYTLGDPKVIEQAGYEKIGNVQIAQGQSSGEIEHALALEQRIAWIETAHFKVGVELPACRVDRLERKDLNEELERLRKRLPRVKANASVLDPWLRAHLVAQRAEDTYAEFRRQFQLPETEESGAVFLGMKSKYAILIFTKESTLGTYAQTFLRREAKTALQHYLDNDTMLYLDALEIHKPEHRLDLGVRARMAYNVAVNLLDGYGGFRTHSPPWFREGYGQVLARAVHGKYAPIFDPRMYEIEEKLAWEWSPRVYGRAKHGIATAAEKLFALEKSEHLDFPMTMDSWSRVEYLLALSGEGAKKFLDALQEIDVLKLAEPERVAKQKEALSAAFGFDAAGFDEQWRAYVLKSYERR